MRRIKLKRIRKFDKISILFIVIILLIMSIIMLLSFLNYKISPLLLDFAESKTRNMANLVIVKAVNKQLSNEIDNLFFINKNKDDEIQTIDFNPSIVNKVLSTASSAVYQGLKAIEEGNIEELELLNDVIDQYDKNKLRKGIIFEVPMGVVIGNAFLANLGPRIPVKLSLLGSVTSNINTKISQYGINNALVEVSVKIEVIERVNLPLSSRNITVVADIPIALKIIQGKIPIYYNSNGLNQSSPIVTLPIE